MNLSNLVSFARAARLFGVHPHTLQKRLERDPCAPPWHELDGRRYFERELILSHYEKTVAGRKAAAGL